MTQVISVLRKLVFNSAVVKPVALTYDTSKYTILVSMVVNRQM